MGLRSLLQSHSGLFKRTEIRRAHADEPEVITEIIRGSRLMNTSPTDRQQFLLSGAGTAVSSDGALIPALGEALERYCATVFSEDQFIWATADELGSTAIDLDSFPVCSVSELSNPACPLQRPSKKDKIRWVRGLSLTDGRLLYLPLISAYLTSAASNSERFLNSISTGCAVHSSYESALLTAILEVIERDALSICWLQQLPLPTVELEGPATSLGELWTRYQSSSANLKITFYDATTDIGVPVIYGIRESTIDRRLHTVVACSSSLNPSCACRKVMLELASCTSWLRQGGSVPDLVEDFDQAFHGAAYMAHERHAHAFNFLLEGNKSLFLAQVGSDSPVDSGEDNKIALGKVLNRLSSLQYPVYAVDLSTDEAIRAGMRAVRAVIPGLMPFSWIYRARYLGHARLYHAPHAMGYPVRSEAEINSWPQPFG